MMNGSAGASPVGMAALAVAAVATGLAAGAGVAVLVARAPGRGDAPRPPGRCPRCGDRFRAADMIPLAGWMRMRGRCRACGRPVGAWRPAVELATAAVFLALALRLGPSPVLPAYCYLGVVGVALAVIDARHLSLPDQLTLPSYPIALALLAAGALTAPGGGRRGLEAVIGMGAALLLFFLFLVVDYPAGADGSDVKLAGLLGLYLGWFGLPAFLAWIVAALALTGAAVAVRAAAARTRRRSPAPLGACMLAAALAVILASAALPALR